MPRTARTTISTLPGRAGSWSAASPDNYLRENIGADHDYSVLSLRQYPMPVGKVRELVEHVDELLVIEDGYPLVESMLRGLFGLDGVQVKGRMTGELPRTGELNPDIVREALGLPLLETAHAPETELANRPPALCKGCPHTDTFRPSTRPSAASTTPRSSRTSAATPWPRCRRSRRSTAAWPWAPRIGMAAGAAHAGYAPAVAAIGDSTFSHGGITPLLSAVQQRVNLNVLVVDNSTVGMTGTQRSMSTGETLDQIILGTGIEQEHFRIIEPLPKNHDANVAVIREELAYDGPSVIVARRACIEALKRRPA